MAVEAVVRVVVAAVVLVAVDAAAAVLVAVAVPVTAAVPGISTTTVAIFLYRRSWSRCRCWWRGRRRQA